MIKKKTTHVAFEYDEFSLGSVKKCFVFKNTSASEIESFIKTFNLT